MRAITDESTIAELKRIAALNGGLLIPEEVVRHARSSASPLHGHFTWDDSKAASSWRIEQARRLIKVTVEYVGDKKEPVRVFVSLTSDRREEHGGYRATVAVMNDAMLRAQLLRDAFAEMQSFREKYKALRELAEVFDAMEKAESQEIRQSV